MTKAGFTRRGFAGAIGAAVSSILLDGRVGTTIADASLAANEPPDFIQLNANENPYGPSDAAKSAIAASTKAASRYPDALVDEVRTAIARSHNVSEKQILLGCGSSQILQMADLTFLGPGRNVVAAEPTFEAVLSYAAVIHADAVKVPLTHDFRHDLSAMANACDEHTGLVYICNPNNPTGTLVGANELAAFVERVPPSTLVLVDEAYHHFVEDARYKSAIDILPRFPNLAVARTFSKIFGLAGMRLGYAIASESLIERLGAEASWDNVNAAVLSAALASLNDSGFVGERRRMLNDTRRWLCSELAKDGRRFIPSEANFLMIDVAGDVAPAGRAFRERKILVGRKFPSMPNWLRVSIGTREEMRAFLNALREIVPAKAKAA